MGKLTFWVGTDRDNAPIPILDVSTAPIIWCKLHWALTDEDWVVPHSVLGRLSSRLGFRHYRQPKWVQRLYADFATLCMPENGFAYAILSAPWGILGFDRLRSTLESSGLHSHVLGRKEGKKGEVLIAELQKEHVGMVFEDNSLQVERHFLLIAKDRIENWAERVTKSYESHGFSYDLLNRLEVIVCNYWEHGIEATSTVMKIETLRDIASRVSDDLNVPLKIEANVAEHNRKKRRN